MFDACVFDLYGTLVQIHTDEGAPHVWQAMARHYCAQGVQWTGEQLKARYFALIAQMEAATGAAHPEIPVIFITRPKPYYNEEEIARREVVWKTYENARARGEWVYFVDGERVSDVLGGDGITVDGCHPNDLGFACVAAALEPLFAEIYKL